MSLIVRVAFTIIVAGLFVVAAFLAINYDALNQNFFFILVPLVGFLFFFGFAVGQRLVLPVKKLLEVAEPLENGNGRSRMYLKTQDEIGQLARTFNKIAEKFEEHKSKIETLDVNVKLRTRALEEIIDILERKIKNRTADWRQAVEELERAHAHLEMKNREIVDLQKRLAARPQKSAKKDHARIARS